MTVFDTEGDGLFPSKFHVLSYHTPEGIVSLTSHKEMAKWLVEQKVLIGHNITLWDIPQLERVLKIKVKARLIDTLALSWYLYPLRHQHGLEEWGEAFGIEKPPVVDWEGEPLSVYVNRCEEDVKINQRLWERQSSYLSHLYNSDEVESLPIVKYLSFKMDCAREQERSRWRLDRERVISSISILEEERNKKIEALTAAMPYVEKVREITYPLKPYKKDGTLSVQGAKWQQYLNIQGLTNDHKLPISVVVGQEPPNPASPVQVKDWLFSLGWKPETFKDAADGRRIPQINKLNEPELCDSVLRLAKVAPAVEHLAGLGVVNHRLGILRGFLGSVDKEGFVKARIGGLTNTLRFKHREIVNLPGVDTEWGTIIREVLIARDGYELLGSDMTALEDLTKRHYMYPYDPDYVKEMSREGFDPHLDLAVVAGRLTLDDISDIKEAKKKFSTLRHLFKTTNYSATYGVGKDKLARDLDISVKEAKALLDTYWSRNWSVRKVAEEQKIVTVNGQEWLLNPISGFYYSLRNRKDIFSTLNQGTGVYCFDSWVREVRKERPQLTAQFHDECVLEIKKGHREEAEKLLRNSIKRVNEKLKLNVQLDISVQFGNRYSDIH